MFLLLASVRKMKDDAVASMNFITFMQKIELKFNEYFYNFLSKSGLDGDDVCSIYLSEDFYFVTGEADIGINIIICQSYEEEEFFFDICRCPQYIFIVF